MSSPTPTDASAIPPLARLPDEWAAAAQALGGRVFHGKQIFRWIHTRGVTDPAKMSDLPASLRQKLLELQLRDALEVTQERRAEDGTRKLLVTMQDGASVETVLIPEVTRGPTGLSSPVEPDADSAALDDDEARDEEAPAGPAPKKRVTQCISTQVGCAMGCVFCASGLSGVVRNLTTAEILEQMLQLARLLPPQDRLSHIVVMGMGEPLANLPCLLPALELAGSREGLGISARRITISTVGLPAAIRRLAGLNCQYHLAVSLHAPDDALRNQLVPANRKVGIEAILQAADEYFTLTGRRLMFEYVLLADVNDRPEHARELVELLRERSALLNLIPYNPVQGLPYRTPHSKDVARFVQILADGGVNVKIRYRKGNRIDAACGQLRRLAEGSAESRVAGG